MTIYFSEYHKAALRNDIRQKEADLQTLRYGDAMRGAVSIYMIYRIYKNVLFSWNQNSIKISSLLSYVLGMYEEPLQKVESMIEDHAEHFKATVVQKYPTAKNILR